MNPVLRGLAIYFFLLIVFRLMGKKSLKETILQAARLSWGIEKMEQIKYAVLERDGSISIIPYSASKEK